MSEESIAPPSTANYSFAQNWIGKYSIPTVNINGDCLEQSSVSFIHGNVVNLYISYELGTWSKNSNTEVMLGNCLFRGVKLTENDDFDK